MEQADRTPPRKCKGRNAKGRGAPLPFTGPLDGSVIAVLVQTAVAVDGAVTPANTHGAARRKGRMAVVITAQAAPGIARAMTVIDPAFTGQVDPFGMAIAFVMAAPVTAPAMVTVIVPARDMAAPVPVIVIVVIRDGRADQPAHDQPPEKVGIVAAVPGERGVGETRAKAQRGGGNDGRDSGEHHSLLSACLTYRSDRGDSLSRTDGSVAPCNGGSRSGHDERRWHDRAARGNAVLRDTRYGGAGHSHGSCGHGRARRSPGACRACCRRWPPPRWQGRRPRR